MRTSIGIILALTLAVPGNSGATKNNPYMANLAGKRISAKLSRNPELVRFHEKVIAPMATALGLALKGKLTHTVNPQKGPIYKEKVVTQELRPLVKTMDKIRDHEHEAYQTKIKSRDPRSFSYDYKRDYAEPNAEYGKKMNAHDKAVFKQWGTDYASASIELMNDQGRKLYRTKTIRVRVDPAPIIENKAIPVTKRMLKRATADPVYDKLLKKLMRNPDAMAKFLNKWKDHRLTREYTPSYEKAQARQDPEVNRELNLYHDIAALGQATIVSGKHFLAPDLLSRFTGREMIRDIANTLK